MPNFYEDQPYTDIANLSRRQSANALSFGDQAAKYADPFMGERPQYQNQLKQLMTNPGEFGSSPVYEFAYNKGLDAINRRAAAQGRLKSGNYLAELMDYGKKSVSELYYPQANLLSNLAMSGSSPSSAGRSYAYGTERAQDYESLAQAAKSRGQINPQMNQNQTPWWAQSQRATNETNAPGLTNMMPASYGLPSGGYDYSGYTQPGYTQPGGMFGGDYGAGNLDYGADFDSAYGGDYGGYGGGYGGGDDYWTGNLDYSADFGDDFGGYYD
jgi:hypothetical protein